MIIGWHFDYEHVEVDVIMLVYANIFVVLHIHIQHNLPLTTYDLRHTCKAFYRSVSCAKLEVGLA